MDKNIALNILTNISLMSIISSPVNHRFLLTTF